MTGTQSVIKLCELNDELCGLSGEGTSISSCRGLRRCQECGSGINLEPTHGIDK